LTALKSPAKFRRSSAFISAREMTGATFKMTDEATRREQRRSEVRDILLFIRAANRLREVTTKYDLDVMLRWEPASVQPDDPQQIVLDGMKITQMADPLVIENIATRIRPFMLNNEQCYFPRILKRLRRHVVIEGGPLTFDELAEKWNATLNATTAPMPAGTRVPQMATGRIGTTMREGQMILTIDHEVLTGREVIELLLYGELVHVDRQKEKKLLRIRESEMATSFQLVSIAIIAALGKLIDILRVYAVAFIEKLPAELIEEIDKVP
jgi:hypothetical protein